MKKINLSFPLLFFTLFCSLSSSSALASPLSEDTLFVRQAYLDASFPLFAPFRTDSVNLKGEQFDPVETLKHNAVLAMRRSNQKAEILQQGTALNKESLHVVRFTIDTEKWKKVKLNVAKTKRFDMFLNGSSIHVSELPLRPGRSEVALLVYSDRNATDTFHVSLVGKDLKDIKLNNGEKRKFLLDDMKHGERFYNVSISPSGRYLLTHYYETNRNGSTNYRSVLSEPAKNKTLLRTNSYADFTWMPKRDVLYATKATEHGTSLIALDPATMKEETVATGMPEGSFRISPNEKFLIFNLPDEQPQSKGALKQLLHPDDRQPEWRHRSSLFYFDISSGTLQRLTFGKENIHLEDITDDGSRILFMRHTMKPERSPFSLTDVYEMTLATGQVDTLLFEQPWIEKAQYSPDSRQILFTASPAAFEGIGSEVKADQHPQSFDKRLFLYDIKTQKASPLLQNFKPSVAEAAWHTADNNIYMKCVDGYDETIWKLDPKTGKRHRFDLPVSYVERYSIANTPNPAMAFFGQTGTSSRNAYFTHLSSSRPKCTPFGEISFEKLYHDTRVASCTPWSFTSSRGDQIEGFYYLPADFDAEKKYPMIVYYYGGCMPTSRVLEFHYPLSVLANMGYVVLVVEPSGAIGFGQEFAARHVNTWGKMSADDIIEGTKAFCKSHAYVNTQKIGCMGASYGGFMTQYLQTQTDIFATGVSHAGISNIASYWGGGYWGYTYGETAMYGSYPWNNPDLYIKQSALFQADKIKTPLLLIHGTQDTNVPTNESQQLFTALRILGREVSYIEVPAENHVIMDYFKRSQWQEAIMAWFAKHLQDNADWWKELGFE